MERKPILNGLVLAGGKSTRMGEDKGFLKWHEKEQRYFMADMLRQFCTEVFISCTTEQAANIPPPYKTLTDRQHNRGPLSGILSGFDYNSKSAWLVVPCDLPLLNEATIAYLIQHRNEKKIATTYKSPLDGMPEPIVAIWEPKAWVLLQTALLEGGGPRKVLMNNEIEMISAPDPSALLNANTPEEVEKLKALLASRSGVKSSPGNNSGATVGN